jgi:hypothetical protein
VYDAALGEFALLFESPSDPEVGSFEVLDAGAEFHLVVAPFCGASEYTLHVRASCCAESALQASAATEPDGVKHRRAAREEYRTGGGASEDEEEPGPELYGVLVEVDDRGDVRAHPLLVVLPAAAAPR